MNKEFKKGIFPTMVTPFTEDNSIDFSDLERFIEKLENDGSDGLFAVCQSSEMFFLSIDEKVELAAFVKDKSKLEVIASGHTQASPEDQINAMYRIEQTGVDAVVLLSNAFAEKDENDDVMLRNIESFLENFHSDIPLGIYECPYPYKRLISQRVLKYLIETERFFLMKDTSCDADIIGERLGIIKDSKFGLYNANAHTLAFSTLNGAAGFSGVHANVSAKLVSFIIDNPVPMNYFQAEGHRLFYELAYFMQNSSYPVSAKIMLKKDGIFKSIKTRVIDSSGINPEIYESAGTMLGKIKEFEAQL